MAQDLQGEPLAVAEASSGWPWARVHGCGEPAAGKALCPGPAQSG